MGDTTNRWRYWHREVEWCDGCQRMRALNREGLCHNGHQIHHDSHEILPVRGSFRRGALSFPLKAPTHAQAANLLREWNQQDSWRDIAEKLILFRVPNGMSVDAVATMLSKYARRESERDEVCRLLGFKPPKKYVVAFHLDNPADAERLRQLFKRHGETYREVAEKLLSGELELREQVGE